MVIRKANRFEDMDQLDSMISSSSSDTRNYLLNRKNNPSKKVLENYKQKIVMQNRHGRKKIK